MQQSEIIFLFTGRLVLMLEKISQLLQTIWVFRPLVILGLKTGDSSQLRSRLPKIVFPQSDP